ncbi:hypothetical protein GCM10022409_14860 [Hymenobacter glaciei]|uniref:Fibronectin type-III domain-containing protein n=1 Tax=Hymenobacter glaciei TaxID=877209 RepID=A0ABP7TUX5_9BACT
MLLLATGAARATNPVLLIQGTGNGGGDVTAFIDEVQIVQVSNSAIIGSAVANAGFEAPNVGAGTFQYNPTGGSWAFNGLSGISQTGSGFSPPTPPGGAQVALVQGTASIQQTLTLGTGTYVVKFQATQRTNCCGAPYNQQLNVYIDGVLVGNITPPSTGAYAQFTSSAFTVDPPAVTALSPTRNARTAALATDVAVNFSQNIDNATAGNIRVYSAQAEGKKVGSYSTSGGTVTFNPTTNFKPGETVFTTIPTAVASTGGATTTNKQVYQFTTAAGGTGRGNFPSGPAVLTVGNDIRSTAVGDFNGDGSLDLLVANYNSNTVSVRFNDGTGTLSGGSEVSVGTNPQSIAVGDVNADGDLDFVTANFNGTISVRSNNGSGSFSQPFIANPSVSSYANGAALGDVDADGDLDLVLITSTGVSVLRNSGTGSFSSYSTVSVGLGPYTVALGDVDADGDLDVLVANYNSNGAGTVSVRFNDGTGTLSGGSEVSVANRPLNLVLGDVDSDGDLDFLTANDTFSKVCVRLNNGSGTFSGGSDVPVGYANRGLAIGDLDADGDLDFATTNYGNATVSVSFNDGLGNYGSTVTLSTSSSQSMALGDMDADGDLDIVTGNFNSVTVRLNQVPAPTITSISPNPGGLGQSITLTGTSLGSPTALTINGANALANIISNTGTSLVVRVPTTATASGNVSITTVGGTGSLAFAIMAPPGNALAFDGVDDEVRTTATAPAFGTGSFTIETWVRTATASTGTFVAVGSVGGNDYWLGMTNQRAAVSISGGTAVTGTTLINDGRWHHLAGVRNGTQLTIYVDGVAQNTLTNANSASPAAPLGMGSFGNGSFFWPGSLDEVRLWNVAQVPTLTSRTTPAVGTESGLVLAYNFDQGTPATASTGNNAGLTILYDLVSAAPATLTGFALASGNTTSNYVESYALVVPTATAPTAVSNNAFTANWTAPAVGTVTNYLVDVSTSSTFASAISSSPFTVAAGTTTLLVSGQPGGTYYYRVRADKTSVTGQGTTSNAITVAVPSATLSCSAAANNALSFDGGSDYVHTTGTLPATGEFTLETWVNPTALPAGFSGLLLSDNFTGGSMHWQFNGNRVEFSVGGNSPTDQYSTFTVPTGSWSHLAVVYSASAKTVKLYLNGALQNTFAYTTAASVAAQPYSVGGWLSGSPQRFLNGSLNELRVWSVARTDAQVLASYNQALPAQTGLAILYSFDQGVAGGTNTSVTTLNDDSGTGHTGTLNTFALTGATSNWVAGNALAYTLGLTSLSPSSAAPGVTVTLIGSGFTGATAVRFNGIAATFTIVNGSTITAVVPASATTGPITVTGPCGTVTSNSSFTVCALPVATAQNAPATLDVNGNATVAATAVNNGSTANCGPAAAGALSVSPSSFSCVDAVPATVASALSFNSGSSQYVSIPATAAVPVGNSAYTIEAWIKPNQMGDYGIIGWGNYGANDQVNALRLYPGGIHNYWWAHDLSGATGNLAGAWHHVAATFDGTTRRIYLDGVQLNADTPGSSHAVPNANNLRIGSTNYGEYFPGSIDEVRVWNVARTTAQLNTTKGIGLPGGTAGLVAYYRLNEGSGLTTADATGNAGSLGTLTNGPTWTTDAAPVTNGVPVTLTVTDAGGNTATAPAIVTVSVPATPTTTWNGSLSVSPLACQNWSFGQVPDAATNAVIPAGQPRYPTLATGTLATKDLTINPSGSLTLNAGATLQVNGNFANSGTATLSGTVAFVGSAATQTLNNSGGFSTVTVNKASGTVQLAQNLTINSALTLSSGTLTTTGSFQVNLGGSATISESDASYVLGKVVVNRTLAAGAAESFAGLGLTLTPAAGPTAPGATLVTRTTGTAIAGAGTSQSILRSFDVVPTVNTGLNVTMNFAYFDHELNGIPVANLAMFKSVSGGTPWIPQRGTTAAGNTVTKTGIADFSVWTLGNSTNPLPVELAAFTATAENNTAVRLAWATASEKNSAWFEVERSLDGLSFERLGAVAAAGSSSSARSYELLDAKLPTGAALLYYRLKQVDANGTFAYSPVRSVALTGAAAGLALYPNPAHNGPTTLTGALPGTVVTVFDALGRLVTSATADASGTAALVLPAGLPTGVYLVRAGSKALRLTVE